jgi:hypothetical protein
MVRTGKCSVSGSASVSSRAKGRAVVSNFTLDGRKLVPKLKTPFRERSQKGGHPEWWAALYDVRTEIEQTYDSLLFARRTFLEMQM